MEAVNAKEYRELVRASAAFGGLDDITIALPNWHVSERRSVQALRFSLSAQRGIVEAVERGLIKGDVWADQVIHLWEHLLVATGDIGDWQRRESESWSRIRKQRRKGAGQRG